MEQVISTSDLTKRYGKLLAVDHVSLKVEKGEIYGFLGLNGAGKTTTIRMLLGLIRPTAGSAFLSGQKVGPQSRSLWEKVGYLVEIPYAYPELTVWENLEIMRRLRGIADAHAVEKIMERLKLTPYRSRKTKNLSQGNLQRLGIAKALMHNPEILILDEPDVGLDPAGIVEVRELLKDLAFDHGVTIFISSHILEEISKLATRIGIIHQGRLVQEMGIDQLERFFHKKVIVDAHDKKAAQAILVKEGYTVNLSGEGILEVTGEKAVEHPEDIASILVRAGLPPTLLKVEKETLEAYFLRTVRS